MFAPVALCAGRLGKSWSVSSIQGRREEQEDRYAVVPRLPIRLARGENADAADAENGGGLAFFAVYDGHGGVHCARYAAATLHENLIASPFLVPSGPGGSVNIGRALADAFAKTEAGFLKMAHAQKLSSGSTAITAVLALPAGSKAAGSGGVGAGAHGELTVAHVGDSRGVLCRGGKALALTVDHKPEDAIERKRIEAAGGFVTERGYCMRVQGVLAMSRALGNRLLKPIVSATPTVTTFPLQPNDQFFVLASDGLYDVFSNQKVVDIVSAADGPQDASKQLVAKAFEAGSCDNITVLVVQLKGGRNFAALERGEQDTPEAGTEAGRRALAELRAGGTFSMAARARDGDDEEGGKGGKGGNGGAEGGAAGAEGGGEKTRKGSWFFGYLLGRDGDSDAARYNGVGGQRHGGGDGGGIRGAAVLAAGAGRCERVEARASPPAVGMPLAASAAESVPPRAAPREAAGAPPQSASVLAMLLALPAVDWARGAGSQHSAAGWE